jgi:hypothetical protein
LEARVTLDLTRPEHREALRWACNQGIEHAAVRRHEDSDKGQALRALSSPSDSAAIVRALLEGCGVRILDFKETSSFAFASVESLGDGLRIETVHYPAMGHIHGGAVERANVPALILTLLACAECRGVRVNGKRYGCRRNEPRIGDAPACPACDDTGIARTAEARDGALAALREAGR